MRLLQARRLLKKHARHHEEWRCGGALIQLPGRDPYPRFDRRMELYLDLPPRSVDVARVARLLRLFDRLARGKR